MMLRLDHQPPVGRKLSKVAPSLARAPGSKRSLPFL